MLLAAVRAEMERPELPAGEIGPDPESPFTVMVITELGVEVFDEPEPR